MQQQDKWWEAAPVAPPGNLAPRYVVPPNPALVAQKQREQARQDAADQRANESLSLAKAANQRAQQKFDSEDTMAPPPGDTSKTGDEYLATIPPSLAGQVKAMAEGRRAFPTGSALRSPAIQQLIAAATQYDPTLDAANAATRVATRKDFTSGKSAQNITAINTALGHFGTLWQAAQGLKNRSIPAWNALANAGETATGDPRVNKFNLARNAVVNELERVFRGSGGSEADIAQWRSTINSSMSPDQLRESIGQGVALLNSRLQAIGNQYNQGMSRSDDPIKLLNSHSQAVFTALQEGGSGILPDEKGPSTSPAIGGGPTPPPAGPGGTPPSGGPVPTADYSGMVGGPDQSLATMDPSSKAGAFAPTFRNEYDPVMASAMSAFIRRGEPYENAAAFAQSHGFNPPNPGQYSAAVSFAKDHHGATNVNANRTVPTTFGERIASSPGAAGFAGAASGATAGFDDTLGRMIAGRSFDANRHALAALHPTADMVGNLAGGVIGAVAAPELAARYAPPGALALGSKVAGRLGKFAPLGGDAAFGATYGANENPDDPVMGAVTGALTAGAAGSAGRGATRGLANVIAPPAGAFAPVYAQGVFPTLGQRFGRSGLAGRIVNTAEQAAQSIPGIGAMVARARDIPRDAAQLGAFNESLRDLQPFDQIVGETISQLPPGTQPGTDPHVFTANAFDRAYNIARQGMRFAPDANYAAEERAFNTALNDGTLDATQANQVRQRIQTAVGTRLGGNARTRAAATLDGPAYQNAASALQKTARDWAKTDPLKANALQDYIGIFDNAARRNSDPAAVNLLDAADSGYAKYVRVRNAGARVGGDPGTFTMKGLQRAVQQEGGGVASGPFQRGQALMQDYSTAVQPLGDTLSNSGTGERLLTNKLFMGEQGAAGLGFGGSLVGALAAHPGALALAAPYTPGVNALVTRAIAPRSATLPPVMADYLERQALRTRQLAPFIGRAAVPGALAYYGGDQ